MSGSATVWVCLLLDSVLPIWRMNVTWSATNDVCHSGEVRYDGTWRTTSLNRRPQKTTTSTTTHCRPTADWWCRPTALRWTTCILSISTSIVSSCSSSAARSRARPSTVVGWTWRRSSVSRRTKRRAVLATPSTVQEAIDGSSTTPGSSRARQHDRQSVPPTCTRAHSFSNGLFTPRRRARDKTHRNWVETRQNCLGLVASAVWASHNA